MNVNYAAKYVVDLEKEVAQKTNDAMIPFVNKLKARYESHNNAEANIKCQVEIIKSNLDPRNIVVDFTEKEKADVLIMGSRDLSAWKRFFLGSFSDFCQQNAHCPVIIVK
ncbi:15047_t:CDS:2, partial [Funneliformis geosporum]